MTISIRWTRRALRRLDEIGAHIAKNNPVAAMRVIDDFTVDVSRLGDLPFIGRPGRINTTRELIVRGTRYIVAYRVEGGEVQILTILHDAQDLPGSL